MPNDPRPRIGYVLKKYPRLSETFILNEILGVERAGIDVEIFSLRSAEDGHFHQALGQVRGAVTYVPPFRAATVFDAMHSVAELPNVALLRDALAFLDRIPEDKRTALLIQSLWLAHHVRKRRITHLHAHFVTIAAQTAYLVHRFTGVPFSVTAHAKDVYRMTVDPNVFAEIGEAAESVITVCDANRAFIERELVPGRDVRVRRVYNGVPIDEFAMHRRPLRERTAPHIVGVGRLVEKKGFHRLLDALVGLRKRVDCTCEIIGDGEERDALAAKADALGLGDVVTFTGALSRDEVLRRMAGARVVAAPCVVGIDGNRDALPTVLIEAISLGIPAVTTPVGGIAEIVSDDEQGSIVPSDDVPALADALARVLTDDALHARYADNALQRAARFDRDETIPELLAAMGCAADAVA